MTNDPTSEARPEGALPTTAGPGASLEVEYRDDVATLRLVPDSDDVDASARLLCAAVQHVRRRRHARRVLTAVDAAGPAGGTLLAALRSRVGTDVGEIALRRAGSTVMVTVELLPNRVPAWVPGVLRCDVSHPAPGTAAGGRILGSGTTGGVLPRHRPGQYGAPATSGGGPPHGG